jgi:adenosylcobinamide-GDP ribazoletransferase
MEHAGKPLGPLARLADEFILAMTLLTRIPMPPAKAWDEAALGRSIWAYPLVGALMGGIGAAVFWSMTAVGVAATPAAWACIAAMILATGCFHEDGLADFWDGIGGGQTVARKLEIMRDSRIGSYGGAALILSIGIRASLIAALAAKGYAEIGLIMAGLLGRSAIAGVLLALPAARTEGLATTAADPPRNRAVAALAMGVILLVIVRVDVLAAAFLAGAIATAWMIRLMLRQIHGYTGDGLGATVQTVEIAVLIAAAATA